jgi:hypothetical protein
MRHNKSVKNIEQEITNFDGISPHNGDMTTNLTKDQ